MGADSTLLGAGTWLQMEVELAAGGLTLVDVGLNLIDEVWDDKPEDIVSGKIVVEIGTVHVIVISIIYFH